MGTTCITNGQKHRFVVTTAASSSAQHYAYHPSSSHPPPQTKDKNVENSTTHSNGRSPSSSYKRGGSVGTDPAAAMECPAATSLSPIGSKRLKHSNSSANGPNLAPHVTESSPSHCHRHHPIDDGVVGTSGGSGTSKIPSRFSPVHRALSSNRIIAASPSSASSVLQPGSPTSASTKKLPASPLLAAHQQHSSPRSAFGAPSGSLPVAIPQIRIFNGGGPGDAASGFLGIGGSIGANLGIPAAGTSVSNLSSHRTVSTIPMPKDDFSDLRSHRSDGSNNPGNATAAFDARGQSYQSNVSESNYRQQGEWGSEDGRHSSHSSGGRHSNSDGSEGNGGRDDEDEDEDASSMASFVSGADSVMSEGEQMLNQFVVEGWRTKTVLPIAEDPMLMADRGIT